VDVISTGRKKYNCISKSCLVKTDFSAIFILEWRHRCESSLKCYASNVWLEDSDRKKIPKN